MLRKIADNLDAGTSHLDEKGCHKVLNTINLMENGDEELSKLENGLDKLKEKVKQLEDKLSKYENTL